MFERATKLEKVFRRHPGAPVFARLAEHCLRKGHLMKAQVLCEEGRERFPDYPTGHVILGRVYEMQGLWEEARAAFDQGLRLDPDQPAVYRRLARIYRELGNPTLALKCLESAARLDPLSDSVSDQLEQLAKMARAASATTTAPERIVPPAVQAVQTSEQVVPPAPMAVEEPTNPAGIESTGTVIPAVAEQDPVSDADPAIVGPDVTPERPVDDAETPGQVGTPVVDAQVPDPVDPVDPVDPFAPAEHVSPGESLSPAEPASPAEPFAAVQSLPEWEAEDEIPSDSRIEPEPEPVAEVKPAPVVPQPVPASQVPAQESGIAAAAEDVDDRVESGDREAEEEVVDLGIDSSEVAALGEGLFEEGDDEDADPPLKPPPKQKKALSPTPPMVEPESLPAEPEPATTADHEAVGLPIPQELQDLSQKMDTDADHPVGASEQETFAEETIDGDLVQTAGFARRADDGLRDLVGQIQATREPKRAVATEALPAPLATVTLAQLYHRQGFEDRAVQVYQQILAVDPSNESARAGLENLNRPHDVSR